MTNTNNNFSKGQKTIIIIAIFAAAFLISQILSVFIMDLFGVGININKITAEQKYEILGIKLAQLFASLVLFVIPPFIIAKVFKYKITEYLQIKSSPKAICYLLTLLFMIASYPLLSIISEWNASLRFPESIKFLEEIFRLAEETNSNITNLILSGTTISDLLLNILVIAIIPAVGEEFVFRGLLQKYLIKAIKNPHIGIIISAFIFSAIHFSLFGFVPRFILGIFLGYLAWRFSSLIPGIFAHFLNNAFAVCLSFYFSKIGQTQNLEDINIYPDNIYLLIGITVIASVLGLLLFANIKRKKIRKII